MKSTLPALYFFGLWVPPRACRPDVDSTRQFDPRGWSVRVCILGGRAYLEKVTFDDVYKKPLSTDWCCWQLLLRKGSYVPRWGTRQRLARHLAIGLNRESRLVKETRLGDGRGFHFGSECPRSEHRHGERRNNSITSMMRPRLQRCSMNLSVKEIWYTVHGKIAGRETQGEKSCSATSREF